jgi:hypothetical protein
MLNIRSGITTCLFIAAIMVSAGCGGGDTQQAEPEPGADNQNVVSPSDEVDESLEPAVMHAENALPIKPLRLSDTRYMKEMISEEVSQIYRDRGEYIDPRRVIELLRNESEQVQADEPTSQQEDENTQAAPTWRISTVVHEEAKTLFERGNYSASARKWRELPTDSMAFTISVVVHCDSALLKQSYDLISDMELPIFITDERVHGRDCFRLCAGIFPRRQDAAPWMESIRERISDSYPFAMAVYKSGS